VVGSAAGLDNRDMVRGKEARFTDSEAQLLGAQSCMLRVPTLAAGHGCQTLLDHTLCPV